jgi:hypothetical protein
VTENVSKVCHLPRFELSQHDDRHVRPTDPAPPPFQSDRPTLNPVVMPVSSEIDQKTLLRELQAMYFDKN